MSVQAKAVDSLLDVYKTVNRDRLQADQEFAAWLENEYIPIVGAWQY